MARLMDMGEGFPPVAGTLRRLEEGMGAVQAPDLLQQTQTALQEAKPLLTGGLSQEEISEIMRSLGQRERGARADIATTMARKGGAFDPVAFARATAGLRGGTQRAIAGVGGRGAAMKRAGTADYINMLMRLYGIKTGADIQQQQLELAREQGETGLGDVLGGIGRFGLGVATLGVLGRD